MERYNGSTQWTVSLLYDGAASGVVKQVLQVTCARHFVCPTPATSKCSEESPIVTPLPRPLSVQASARVPRSTKETKEEEKRKSYNGYFDQVIKTVVRGNVPFLGFPPPPPPHFFPLQVKVSAFLQILPHLSHKLESICLFFCFISCVNAL